MIESFKKSIKNRFIPEKTVFPPLNFYTSLTGLVSYCKYKLSRDSLVSWKNLNQCMNQYKGQKTVILCNGPSLLKSDLSCLDSVFTIGLNKINLLFDKSSFRPSIIVSVNPLVIDQNKDFFRNTSIPLFLAHNPAYKYRINADLTTTHLFTSKGYPMFSTDVRYSICQGATVTYVALQLAYFLGFSRVALIGCDHNFQTKGPDHKLVKSGDSDPNHFDPNYFAGGVSWQLPSIAESEESYMRAKRFYGYDNRTIYNCTVGGELEVYPRITLDQFMQI